MPARIGLAGFGDMPGVLPMRRTVAPSNGYSGGASWTGGMPLLPSNAGLANALIDGGYGRAGLGAALIDGGYGRAGLGSTGTAADEDLAAAAEAVAVARQLDPADGRTGQYRPRIDEYGRRIAPGVLERSNVIDPSEGGNYGGGSSWEPGIPLTPSNAGLARFRRLPQLARQGPGAAARSPRTSDCASAKPLQTSRRQLRRSSSGIMQKTAKIPSAQATYRLASQRYRAHVVAMCRLRVPAGLGMTPQCQALLSGKPVAAAECLSSDGYAADGVEVVREDSNRKTRTRCAGLGRVDQGAYGSGRGGGRSAQRVCRRSVQDSYGCAPQDLPVVVDICRLGRGFADQHPLRWRNLEAREGASC